MDWLSNPKINMKTKILSHSVSWSFRWVGAFLIYFHPLLCCRVTFAQASETPPSRSAQRTPSQTSRLQIAPAEADGTDVTRPAVTPPQPLALSATPSDEEITRCGLFTEPLVPFLPNPGNAEAAAENAALANALRQYAARTESENV